MSVILSRGAAWLLFSCLLMLALGVRLVRHEHWPGTCLGNGNNEIARIATSLAERGVFADPYIIPTGPTAHHAPVFPWLVALARRLPLPGSLPAQVLLNILFGSVVCASVPFAASALGMRPITGIAAALLLALRPPSLAVELCNDQEAAMVGALMVGAVTCGALWLRGRATSVVVPGLAWGGILLAAPALAPVYAGYVVLGARTSRRWRPIAMMVTLTVLVLMPWVVRNRLVLGAWIPVRSNLGLELRVSNADEARTDSIDNAVNGAMQLYHPLFNAAIAEAVSRNGEPAVYSQMRRDALAWIVRHPRRFFELTMERTRRFWLPDRGPMRDVVFVRLSLLFATAGIVLLYRGERLAGISVLNVLVLYPLVYYFLQSYERYRYPIEWLIVLCAAHAVVWASVELRGLLRTSPRPWPSSPPTG